MRLNKIFALLDFVKVLARSDFGLAVADVTGPAIPKFADFAKGFKF